MRPKKKLTIVVAAAIAVGGSFAIAAPAAEAGQIPCYVGSGGNSSVGGCWSGGFQTWRVVADCVDVSNIAWPTIVDTKYGDWITGDGSETVTCTAGLRADGRLEVR
ncbi:MAG: hypothetical protein QOD41_988 [Cryptosporangiaceae bacterium]|nr:hypothetical protein [Cryptosporangiaceae bacterium]